MSLSAIADQYARKGASLPALADTATIRRAALERFNELGLPGRASETWHYTELKGIADKAFDYIGQKPEPALVARASAAVDGLGLDPKAPRRVFLDGHGVSTLAVSPDVAGLDIASLDSAPSDLLAGEGSEPALVALNTAFASAGALIRISGSVEQPVQLVFVGGQPGLVAQYRLRIELEPQASAAVVLHFLDLGAGGEAWLNLVTDVAQAEDSRLTLYRLQQTGHAGLHTAVTRARLAARANLASAGIELGGKLIRNESLISLDGEAAAAALSGMALTRDQQHCDTRIAVDHRAPKTQSRQIYRAIAADRSRSAFNGKVTVQEHAQHIDARQRNDNLLLSPKAEIDTKPELEIYADQVVCSHGATVGELSEDHLFYLRSRGIDAVAARGILTTAFANVIIDRLEHDDFRERARAAVTAALPQRIEIE